MYRTVHNNTKALPYRTVMYRTLRYRTVRYLTVHTLECRGAALMVLDFAEGGRHLVIDGVVTTV